MKGKSQARPPSSLWSSASVHPLGPDPLVLTMVRTVCPLALLLESGQLQACSCITSRNAHSHLMTFTLLKTSIFQRRDQTMSLSPGSAVAQT